MNRQYSRPSTTSKDPTGPKLSARNKLMDILSRRDHSEKEAREKLKDKFKPEEIDSAIEYAKERGWLPSTPEQVEILSEKVADILKRRGKGPRFINQYLQRKGLLQVKINPTEELEKAHELVENKFFLGAKKKPADSAKVGRFLLARGFSSDVIRKVIYGKLFKQNSD